jgi:hypothetical protein
MRGRSASAAAVKPINAAAAHRSSARSGCSRYDGHNTSPHPNVFDLAHCASRAASDGDISPQITAPATASASAVTVSRAMKTRRRFKANSAYRQGSLLASIQERVEQPRLLRQRSRQRVAVVVERDRDRTVLLRSSVTGPRVGARHSTWLERPGATFALALRSSAVRRGGGAVERTGLENRQRVNARSWVRIPPPPLSS